MFELKIDVAPFFEMTERMNAAVDQMPYALSRSLNDAANDAYNFLIDQTWPKSVTVRNSSFLRWALRTQFSTKHDLSIAIFDNTPDQRAHLAMHAAGGEKEGKGGHRIAVPTANVHRGAGGVVQSQRPANLHNKVVVGNKIYEATGRGKHRKLKLLYVLTKSAHQPADVPFVSDFQSVIQEAATKHFLPRMTQAMRTRR